MIPALIGGPRIPVKEQEQLLDELFDLTAISVGSTVIFVLCIIGMVRSPSLFFTLWASSAVLLLFARVMLGAQYTKRPADASIDHWVRNFSIASAITGLQWSMGTAAFYLDVDGATRMSVFAVECALIAGASGRSYTAPRAAISQVGTVCLGFVGVFLYRHEWLMAGIAAIYLYFNVSTICRLGASTVARIQAECGRRELVDMLAESNDQLSALNARLERMALTDSLTGLANRRGFDAFLKQACINSTQTHQPLALLIADVDHFKHFNDAYGHPAGDACLASVGTVLASLLGMECHFAARYGGEEFAIVLPDTNLAGAVQVANRIRLAISTIRFAAPLRDDTRITISLGGASVELGEQAQPEFMIRSADEALYRAKSDGRDCVRFSPSLNFTSGRLADAFGDPLEASGDHIPGAAGEASPCDQPSQGTC